MTPTDDLMRLISKRLLRAVMRPGEIDKANLYSLQVAALLHVAGYLVRERGANREEFVYLAGALWDHHEEEVKAGKRGRFTVLKGGK